MGVRKMGGEFGVSPLELVEPFWGPPLGLKLTRTFNPHELVMVHRLVLMPSGTQPTRMVKDLLISTCC